MILCSFNVFPRRTSELAGEDPLLAGLYASSMVSGMQQEVSSKRGVIGL